MRTVELTVDVTDVANLGLSAHTAATVYLPEQLCSGTPIVCFGFPGGGYNRHYFALNLDSETGGQAQYHTDRGWIFVACDHLGVGDSTVPEGNVLSYENVARANLQTVNTVVDKLQSGTLLDGFAAIEKPVKLGIGQSMGGCFTIVLQGQHAPFDGIATLGYSAVHTVVPGAPGKPQPQWPWVVRGSDMNAPLIVNQAAMAGAQQSVTGKDDLKADAEAEHPFAWSFHYDDVDRDLVSIELSGVNPDGSLPYWRSASTPPCALQMVSPGTVAPEAAVIDVPVLVAVGERDVVPNPKMEPLAFQSANDISVFICPRMGHMHNFASTRTLFWSRIQHWGNAVAEAASLR